MKNFYSSSLVVAKLKLLCCKSFRKNTHAAALQIKRSLHTPVMAKEVLEILNPQRGQIFLDMTYGSGGHTKSLFSRSDNVTVYGLDRDATAYYLALELKRELQQGNLIPLHGKFSDLECLLERNGLDEISFDGILIDCGCSSMQLDNKERGFALSKNGPLDMRMHQSPEAAGEEPTVADILEHIDETSLARILKIYGEERQAKKIARAIIESRYLFKSLKTTKELAELVECACGFDFRKDKLQRQSHVATKTFQALRIFVNDELNELDYAMNFSAKYLKSGGKLITIAFHSLEDRIIKSHLSNHPTFETSDLKFKDLSRYAGYADVRSASDQRWSPMFKHVLTPSDEEVAKNPRSRSAKLRAAVKVK